MLERSYIKCWNINYILHRCITLHPHLIDVIKLSSAASCLQCLLFQSVFDIVEHIKSRLALLNYLRVYAPLHLNNANLIHFEHVS